MSRRPSISPRRILASDSSWERIAHLDNGERGEGWRTARLTVLNYHGNELRVDIDQLDAPNLGIEKVYANTPDGGQAPVAPGFTVVVAPEATVYVNGVIVWPPRPHVWTPDPERPHLCVGCGRAKLPTAGQPTDPFHAHPITVCDNCGQPTTASPTLCGPCYHAATTLQREEVTGERW